MFKAFYHKFVGAHRVRRNAEHALHTAYCGLIFIEGHGFYAIAGGALALTLIVNWVLGDD